MSVSRFRRSGAAAAPLAEASCPTAEYTTQTGTITTGGQPWTGDRHDLTETAAMTQTNGK